MGTCTSMIDLFGLALIRESIATRWDGRGDSWGQEARGKGQETTTASRAQE